VRERVTFYHREISAGNFFTAFTVPDGHYYVVLTGRVVHENGEDTDCYVYVTDGDTSTPIYHSVGSPDPLWSDLPRLGLASGLSVQLQSGDAAFGLFMSGYDYTVPG